MKDSPSTAAIYDFFMSALDLLLINKWRKILWSCVEGPSVLEAGVGTGLNISYYRPELQVTALDSNHSFLHRASRRAQEKQVRAKFMLGDIQNLPFADELFDTAVTTFVFCQVKAPLLGLQELYRVLKPGGQLLLLEHVRPHGFGGRFFAALAEPFYRLTGEHIARDTERYAANAGFVNVTSTPLFTDGVKIIRAVKRTGGPEIF
ncbi:MAG TPA: class I SAM-dependent methyltransferase [Candidatus Limnocylindrales bacterium]|nr:class I SAM-dependent methyltransferase [Candidatus Limnocylindrales bacterium]